MLIHHFFRHFFKSGNNGYKGLDFLRDNVLQRNTIIFLSDPCIRTIVI
jgi:hypothetical protein